MALAAWAKGKKATATSKQIYFKSLYLSAFMAAWANECAQVKHILEKILWELLLFKF